MNKLYLILNHVDHTVKFPKPSVNYTDQPMET